MVVAVLAVELVVVGAAVERGRCPRRREEVGAAAAGALVVAAKRVDLVAQARAGQPVGALGAGDEADAGLDGEARGWPPPGAAMVRRRKESALRTEIVPGRASAT